MILVTHTFREFVAVWLCFLMVNLKLYLLQCCYSVLSPQHHFAFGSHHLAVPAVCQHVSGEVKGLGSYSVCAPLAVHVDAEK